MKKSLRSLFALAALAIAALFSQASAHEKAIADFLNRIGGQGTADRFVTELVAADGKETFTISSEAGKPKIKGNSLSAITTGIGWYLNHYADVNLAWNNLTTDLTSATLPAPAAEETHTCRADYRYYLNYCTFSYSMSTYTWERWEKEIDWMALHGINMPLQIIGLDEVWRRVLMEEYKYTLAEANAFIAGPCFQAWWGMNNLEGHGGPNPEWWYKRQAGLATKIIERERSLGIEPVIPGFAGTVPRSFQSKTGITPIAQGGWCGFNRPYILNPESSDFAAVAEKYYKHLHAVMGGPAKYYSMDPFHEGANTSGINVAASYHAIYEAMEKAAPGNSMWVAQMWQFSSAQWNIVKDGIVPLHRLLMLDLYSDGRPGSLGNYKGHDVAWCALPNFGARTGFFGRFNKIIDGYFDAVGKYSNITGIGATPEGIEQTPVIYDILFELPWHSTKPDAREWMAGYTRSRYGVDSEAARAAWEDLRLSAINNQNDLQGPQEAIICARPSLTVNKVSSWGSANIFYDVNKMFDAAYQLLEAGKDIPAENANYSYDLTDISRQALTDYSKSLLAGVKEAYDANDNALFEQRRDAFLELILDIDELLNTNPNFMLGHWTELARAIADEMPGTTAADRDWLEKDNARTIITTWGPKNASESGGLRDYSYREMGGMLKDFYYQRWKTWFDNGMAAPGGGWFQWEWNWAHNDTKRYPTEATGSTYDVAGSLLPKYIGIFRSGIDGALPVFIKMKLVNDLTSSLTDIGSRGNAYTPDIICSPDITIAEIAIDFNGNKSFDDEGETSATGSIYIPADTRLGDRRVMVTMTDGTVIQYILSIRQIIEEAREISGSSADDSQGSVSLQNSLGQELESPVETSDFVKFIAIPGDGFEFDRWTDADGNEVSTDNPFVYYEEAPLAITAHFRNNPWGVIKGDNNWSNTGDVASFKQWLSTFTVTQGGTEKNLLEGMDIENAPAKPFIMLPSRIVVAPGGKIKLHWSAPGDGLSYALITVYLDWDGDHTFNTRPWSEANPAGELLKHVGTHGKQDMAANSGDIEILLPFDAKQCLTHLRFRVDGAWSNTGWDESAKAFLPDANTNRFVYEVPVLITDSPDYEMAIEVEVNDPKLGYVDITSSTLLTAGEDAILRAYPTDGCRLDYWTDQYGRVLPEKWMEGDMLRFPCYDSGTFTAHFSMPSVKFGDWEFDYKYMADETYQLTGIKKEGSGDLDLSDPTTPGLTFSFIKGELLANNPDIKTVKLPSNNFSTGKLKIYSINTITGEGNPNNVKNPSVHHSLTTPIPANSPFEITLTGTSSGKDFVNQWGSGFFATGDNALGDTYNGGFQLYHRQKDNLIAVKCGSLSGDGYLFSEVPIGEAFDIAASYDGKDFTVNITSDGNSQTHTFENVKMNKIEHFSYALPTSISFSYDVFTTEGNIIGNIFKDCRNLTAFDAAPGYWTIKDGAVFDATGLCQAYPEGRLFNHAFRLRDTQEDRYIVLSDVATDALGNVCDDGRTVGLIADNENFTHSRLTTSILRFEPAPGDGKVYVRHVNSGLRFGTPGATVEVPTNSATSTQWIGAYDYDVEYLHPEPVIHLSHEGKNAHLSAWNLGFSASESSWPFAIEEVTELHPQMDAASGMAAVAYPLSVVVPDGSDYEFYVVKKLNGEGDDTEALVSAIEPGTIVPAGEPLVIIPAATGLARAEAPLALAVNYTEAAPAITANKLTAALTNVTGLPADGTIYTIGMVDGRPGLVPSTSPTLGFNTAYLTLPAAGPAHIPFTTTPSSYIPGDADGSGQVSIPDVTMTVEMILGRSPRGFVFEAADMDGNGKIEVGDVVAIVNLILHPEMVGITCLSSLPSHAIYYIDADGSLWVEADTDIAGIEFVTSSPVWTPSAELDILSSSHGTTVEGLHTIAYGNASSYLPAGRYCLGTLAPGSSLPSGLILCDPRGSRIETELTPTGIGNLNADIASGRAAVYDLSGRRLSRIAAPGFYIIGGRKTFVR